MGYVEAVYGTSANEERKRTSPPWHYAVAHIDIAEKPQLYALREAKFHYFIQLFSASSNVRILARISCRLIFESGA